MKGIKELQYYNINEKNKIPTFEHCKVIKNERDQKYIPIQGTRIISGH
jgi:hypothetical protein